MDITCDALDCLYNKRRQCLAHAVMVCGDNAGKPQSTWCNTYTKDSGTWLLTAAGHMGASLLTDGLAGAANTRVLCSVSRCLHNQSGACAARSINISSGQTRGMRKPCATFERGADV